MWLGDVSTDLRCIRCGACVELLTERKFRCVCGGLYEVHHDYSKVGFLNPQSLRETFDARCRQVPSDVLTQSGVWRFKELIAPTLKDSEIVSLGEGMFPIQLAGAHLRQWTGIDQLYIMPEGTGPTGSFKDLGGTVALSVAKKAGIRHIACASTGDTSAMAAAYAAAAGISCVVLLPKNGITAAQLAQPLVYGATVIQIPGTFDDAMRILKELIACEKVFPVNSLNPTRIEGHQASVFLACQYLNWWMPDVFALPLGNGSNTSSIAKGMRTLKQLDLVAGTAQIIATQSSAANPLARSWEAVRSAGSINVKHWLQEYQPQGELGKTSATAARIGDPVSYEKVIRAIVESEGAVVTAPEDQLCEARLVAGKDGLDLCPQTGMALAGLKQARARNLIRSSAITFVISTATGLKFPSVDLSQVLETKTTAMEEVAELIGV